MLMHSGAEYVATASTSHPQDLERKIKAACTRLPAFIQILTPCNPSWGYDDHKGVEVSRLAVESGMWPLYEWKDGVFGRQNIPASDSQGVRRLPTTVCPPHRGRPETDGSVRRRPRFHHR